MELNSYKKNRKRNDISVYSWTILVFLMIFLPAAAQLIKIILIILAVASMNKSYSSRLKISNGVIIFYIFWMLFYIGNVVLGIIYDTPGKWAVARLNILYFIVFFVLIGMLNRKKYLYAMIDAMYWANMCISIYNFAYLAFARNGYIGYFPIIDPTSGVGLHETYTHITTTNLSMLIFTFPLLLLISKETYVRIHYGKKRWNIMLALTAAIMIFSGRRILWIALAISAFVLIVVEEKKSLRINYIFFTGVLTAIVLMVLEIRFGVTIGGIIGRFKTAFSSVDEYGASNVRYIQIVKLWNEFLTHPIFGKGAGAAVGDYVRAEAIPWAFELSYNKMLLDGGLIGILLYACALISIAYQLLLRRKSQYARSFLTAYLIGIIANATNPYFSQNFDFLIFLIAPLMYINITQNIYKKDSEKAETKQAIITI